MGTLLTATPGQTIGPFYGYALPFERGNELVPPGVPGSIRFHGLVTDGAGEPVPDVMLEIWQADGDGTTPIERVVAPRRVDVHGLGPGLDRRRGPLQLHHCRTRAD